MDRERQGGNWQGRYVVFDQVRENQQLTVTYPLRIMELKETINGVEYTEKWRGNTMVGISPGGKMLPMYHRPELDTCHLPSAESVE